MLRNNAGSRRKGEHRTCARWLDLIEAVGAVNCYWSVANAAAIDRVSSPGTEIFKFVGGKNKIKIPCSNIQADSTARLPRF